jgi:hypothetical protein
MGSRIPSLHHPSEFRVRISGLRVHSGFPNPPSAIRNPKFFLLLLKIGFFRFTSGAFLLWIFEDSNEEFFEVDCDCITWLCVL